MKCYIKKQDSDVYFKKYLGMETAKCKWSFKEEAKLFDSVGEAKATIKVYKLKNVEVEKCLKKQQ